MLAAYAMKQPTKEIQDALVNPPIDAAVIDIAPVEEIYSAKDSIDSAMVLLPQCFFCYLFLLRKRRL